MVFLLIFVYYSVHNLTNIFNQTKKETMIKLKSFILLALFIPLTVLAAGQSDNFNAKTSAGNDGHNTFMETSLLRMQDRVIVGIDLSVIPSVTKMDERLVRTHASFKVGYKLSKNVFSGSLGVEFTDEMFLPLTLEYKRYFNQEIWAPYVYVQSGISWHLRGNMESHYHTSNYSHYDTGLIAMAGFGYSVTSLLNEFYFSLGYAYRSYIETYPVSWDDTQVDDRSMHGIAITAGFNF